MREDCAVEECGMKTVPLFDIDPGFVIPDVLHMRIRIVNRLIDGLVADVEDRDNRDKVLNIGSKGAHLDTLVCAINSCGVRFAVWKDERKGRNFTSLPGDACERVLKMLPGKLRGVIQPETEEKTIQLWELLSKNPGSL
ncbi:hypothetical protein HPB48_014762 [Haemaphysalis longicornis]|uniref:Uncharacterized protein n=1 Tax=Haemaphysalis longicornis TaxID=44386 RepID=A0A9J6FV97_HAELO|nr:hypothetical protein HPB48_014762 [Haemaphysalis longicornis]